MSALAYLLKTRAVTSTDLTELYLSRLERYDKVLQAVVTLTRETAFAQAARADVELDAGAWRGPLHGIPYGAKDLLAVRGYPTTWGATPYQDQTIDEDAEVVLRLEAAGAVLLAKLTLGCVRLTDGSTAGASPALQRFNQPCISASRAWSLVRVAMKRRQRCAWPGLLSIERDNIWGAEVLRVAKGNTCYSVLVRRNRAPRCQRTQGRAYVLRRDLRGLHTALLSCKAAKGRRQPQSRRHTV